MESCSDDISLHGLRIYKSFLLFIYFFLYLFWFCFLKMDHLLIKQKDEIERMRNQMKKNKEDHQEQIENLKNANEQALAEQQKENFKNNQALNREILNLKKENKNNLQEIKRLSAKPNLDETRSDWQGSFESADESSDEESAKANGYQVPSDWQGSCEVKSTPGYWHVPYESADESSDEECPFERASANPPSTENERIEQRTAAATRRATYTLETQTTLDAVKKPSFVSTLLDAVAGGAAVVGAAVSVAVPGLATIAAPVASLVGGGAMLLKKFFC